MAVRLALALLATVGASGVAYSQWGGGFEWPATNASAIPDARLSDFIETAREDARQAADLALEGRRASAFAKRHTGIRGLVGLGGKPTTIDGGTVMTAVPANGESGPMVGTVSYPSGATMTGAFGPDIGVYSPSPTSSIAQFAGWCYGARTSNPRPNDGEFRFKSGDVFVGSRTADTFTGIYQSANDGREFIGTMLLDSASPRPVQGIMQDRNRHLLAVIRLPG